MRLTVVIPSRTDSNLVQCIADVRHCEANARIIVVDDGLTFGIPEQEEFIRYHAYVVPGIKPFIFSRNINIGIKSAGTDDVVLLNDDALLKTTGGFTVMQQAAEEHPEFGVIAATTNNVGNRNQLPQSKGLREDDRMVCFVAVLVPRRTIDVVGLLDERFIHYGMDDDDYSLRVRNAGLKIGIHDGCYVDHGSLASTYRGPAGAGGDFIPNLKIFIQKWGVDNWGKTRETSDFPQCFV